MDFDLRTIVSAPQGGGAASGVDFAFSTSRAFLVTSHGSSLVAASTSSLATSSTLRASTRIQKLLHVGSCDAFLALSEGAEISTYIARAGHALVHVSTERLESADREPSLAASSPRGSFAVFCKADSPSIWCISLQASGVFREIFKLRPEIEGSQGNVTAVDSVLARVRGRVAPSVKSRSAPAVALAVHDSRPLVVAAYANGIVRVWNLQKKEQYSHFDAQLMIGEKINDIALHPRVDYAVVCTSHGRLISFQLQTTLFKRGAEPALAATKVRQRRHNFLRVCFLPTYPSYLVALTKSRRVLVRLLTSEGQIVESARFRNIARPLPLEVAPSGANGRAKASTHAQEIPDEDETFVSMRSDNLFGMLALSFGRTGDVYLYQRKVDRMPYVARPLSAGIDSMFTDGRELGNPLVVARDALFTQASYLYSYTLGKELTTRLCRIPAGDVRSIHVARDPLGSAVAALVFLYIDEVADTFAERTDPSTFSRYVLCTKRGEGEPWNASEPSEGRAGCFLNRDGYNDQVLIISANGFTASIYSFATRSQKLPSSRGVRRVKLAGDRANGVFRTPFCDWMAVAYFDASKKRLAVSKNTFRNVSDANETYMMDESTQMPLAPRETVLDIRWQSRWTRREGDQWFGAILTDKHVYFVQDVLNIVSRINFSTLERTIADFSLPTMLWMGPSVVLLFGSAIYSVAFDGTADFIAGLSHGQNAATLLAALPDRLVYVKPTNLDPESEVSVSSRPFGAMSILVRSALALPWTRQDSGANIDEISELLRTKDATQGSEELIETLIQHKLAPIAYLVCVSEQGRHIVPPLKRASFLARIGDIRGALRVIESEYARLPDADAFHSGTELYRLSQRIMNMAIVCGDFAVAKRCSALLGRRGTFEGFVESEGGYPALRTISEYARNTGNPQIAEVLEPLLSRSAQSCIASDASRFPSAQEIRNTRRAVESLDVTSVALGTKDEVKIAVFIPKQEEWENGNGQQHAPPQSSSDGQKTVLETPEPTRAAERLETFVTNTVLKLATNDDDDDSLNILQRSSPAVPSQKVTSPTAPQTNTPVSVVRTDSSDEEDEFFFGQKKSSDAAGHSIAAQRQDVVPARTNVVYNPPGSSGAPSDSQGHTPGAANPATGQANTTGTGKDLEQRVFNILERGMRKVDEGRYEAALSDFESGIKAAGRAAKAASTPGISIANSISPNLRTMLGRLVGYRMGMKLCMAVNEVRYSHHSQTLIGQVTMAQLATALGFTYGLHPRHAIWFLSIAAGANMSIGNFGVASKCLVQLRQSGETETISDHMKKSLRDKYAQCQAHGFRDARAGFSWRLCFESLRLIPPGEHELCCIVCPARFSVDCGLCAGERCTCCRIGSITNK